MRRDELQYNEDDGSHERLALFMITVVLSDEENCRQALARIDPI